MRSDATVGPRRRLSSADEAFVYDAGALHARADDVSEPSLPLFRTRVEATFGVRMRDTMANIKGAPMIQTGSRNAMVFSFNFKKLYRQRVA